VGGDPGLVARVVSSGPCRQQPQDARDPRPPTAARDEPPTVRRTRHPTSDARTRRELAQLATTASAPRYAQTRAPTRLSRFKVIPPSGAATETSRRPARVRSSALRCSATGFAMKLPALRNSEKARTRRRSLCPSPRLRRSFRDSRRQAGRVQELRRQPARARRARLLPRRPGLGGRARQRRDRRARPRAPPTHRRTAGSRLTCPRPCLLLHLTPTLGVDSRLRP
jgi:hypothetical protein